jgi:hypothetical protein
MKVENCWCRKASPIRLIKQDKYVVVYQCLMCNGTITVYLNYGEEWKERSSGE